jgi:hypothetical protein
MQSVRRFYVFILSLLLFLCPGTISKASESEAVKSKPSSTLVEGSWAVDARLKVTVHINGYKSETVHENAYDVFTFNPDSTFEMTDASGYWREKARNFSVYFDAQDVDNLFYEIFGDYDINVNVNVTKCIITGTVGKSTIRGTMTFRASFYLPDYGLGGTIAATIPFSGAPTTDPYDASSAGQSLKEIFRGVVGKSIKATLQK